MQRVAADYLVVGAGASGLAFTDALVEHAPGVRVALVDRRHGVGGHWLAAYPFVRLHQASTFYGVASTVLGGDRRQPHGPEAGLHERADQAKVCSYYGDVLADRLLGATELFLGCEYLGDRTFVSRVSGRHYSVPDSCRVVDARYLAPDVPAEDPPRFEVLDGARVVPVNALAHLDEAPSQYVVVGSGKTATDACVWLLGRGVDPDAICWVRPRDPWMLNRAVVRPDPAVYLGMVATMLESGAASASLDEVFRRLEDAGVMLRIDPAVTPTMAKAPTLGEWELELLRSITDVVRRGHLVSVSPGRLTFASGSRAVRPDALVVNCASDGLKSRPLLPIWQSDVITLQPVRAGFPCFGAAVTGYVEATRRPLSDADKNRLCAPSSLGNTLADWARMNVLGTRNLQALAAEADTREWINTVALNPARVPATYPSSDALSDAQERLAAATEPALAQLARLVAGA